MYNGRRRGGQRQGAETESWAVGGGCVGGPIEEGGAVQNPDRGKQGDIAAPTRQQKSKDPPRKLEGKTVRGAGRKRVHVSSQFVHMQRT